MRASAVLATVAVVVLVAGPARAQERRPAPPARERDPGHARERRGQDGERRPATREERARLLEQYRKLPPEERARLRRLYEDHVRGRSPDEVQAMRRALRQRIEREAAQAAERRRRFEQRPAAERKKYAELMRRLLRELPPEQRRQVLQLPPDQRKERLHRLIQEHRRGLVEERLRGLPADVRTRTEAELSGLDPKERFRRARTAVEGYVRDELRRILTDPSLAQGAKLRRVNELLRRLVPDAQRREQLRRRVQAELERRRQERHEGQRAGEPGGAEPGTDRGRQRPRRQQQQQ
jgi:hypothetical protein